MDDCPRTDVGRRALVSVLREQHPLHRGRSTHATARLRGYTLAAFERVGLPANALPFVLEELQSGDEAILIAAAAKALRGASTPADVGFALPFLESARANVSFCDAPVRFDDIKPSLSDGGFTTASREIDKTIEWIGTTECCAPPAFDERSHRSLRLDAVELEDQRGRRIRFGEFFTGKPAVVAFFYSRCEAVRKCSLTITKLAALQRELTARGLEGQVRLSAITYDPLFDLPARLERYGHERGIHFTDDVCFFRVPDRFAVVRVAFDLGVNYVGSLVNRHAIELYLLDRRGRITSSFSRLAWREEQVADTVETLLQRGPIETAGRTLVAGASALTVALLPKCPFCFGAYASALGSGAIQLAPYRRWLLPIAILCLVIHLVSMAKRAASTHRLAPLMASMLGAGIVIAGSSWSVPPPLSLGGAVLMIGAAIASAKDHRGVGRLSLGLRSARRRTAPARG
ncbi:MAG: SCO family protein [Acidobacteriota bacterium]